MSEFMIQFNFFSDAENKLKNQSNNLESFADALMEINRNLSRLSGLNEVRQELMRKRKQIVLSATQIKELYRTLDTAAMMYANCEKEITEKITSI